MKNITVSVDEETHRLARIRAAEMGTSVSALVRGYLTRLRADSQLNGAEAPAETADQRCCRMLQDVLADFDAKGVGLRTSDRLPRAAVHDRAAARAEAIAERERDRSIAEALEDGRCNS